MSASSECRERRPVPPMSARNRVCSRLRVRTTLFRHIESAVRTLASCRERWAVIDRNSESAATAPHTGVCTGRHVALRAPVGRAHVGTEQGLQSFESTGHALSSYRERQAVETITTETARMKFARHSHRQAAAVVSPGPDRDRRRFTFDRFAVNQSTGAGSLPTPRAPPASLDSKDDRLASSENL
jgi:hypothetical protein